jgi:N12 class adenine-specific DNA methylase
MSWADSAIAELQKQAPKAKTAPSGSWADEAIASLAHPPTEVPTAPVTTKLTPAQQEFEQNWTPDTARKAIAPAMVPVPQTPEEWAAMARNRQRQIAQQNAANAAAARAASDQATKVAEMEEHPIRSAFIGPDTFVGGLREYLTNPKAPFSTILKPLVNAAPAANALQLSAQQNPSEMMPMMGEYGFAMPFPTAPMKQVAAGALQSGQGFLEPQNIALIEGLGTVGNVTGGIVQKALNLKSAGDAALAAEDFDKAAQLYSKMSKLKVAGGSLIALQRTAGTAFTYQFAKALYGEGGEFKQAIDDNDPQEAMRILGEALPNAAFTIAGVREIIEAGKRVSTGIQERSEARRQARADVGLGGNVQPEIVPPEAVPENLQPATPAKRAPGLEEEPEPEPAATPAAGEPEPEPKQEVPSEPAESMLERRKREGAPPSTGERRGIPAPPSRNVLDVINQQLQRGDLTDRDRQILEAQKASLLEHPEEGEAVPGTDIARVRAEAKPRMTAQEAAEEYQRRYPGQELPPALVRELGQEPETSAIAPSTEEAKPEELDQAITRAWEGREEVPTEPETEPAATTEAVAEEEKPAVPAGRPEVPEERVQEPERGEMVPEEPTTAEVEQAQKPEASTKFTPETPRTPQSNVDRFIETYKTELQQARAEHPERYTWPPSDLERIVGLMRTEISRGRLLSAPPAETKGSVSGFMLSSTVKATAKKLGIKPTYKAIREFLKTRPETKQEADIREQARQMRQTVEAETERRRNERLAAETWEPPVDTGEERRTLPSEEEGHEPTTGREAEPAEEPVREQPLGEPSEGALETVPSEDVRGTGEEGTVAREGGEGGGADRGRLAPSGERRGTRPSGGVGSGEGAVPVPAERGGPAGPRGTELDSGRAGADYRITDADQIGIGGERTKYRNNVAAIRTLKRIELEGRQATPAEQAVLVKYVGWGGIASNQLFNPETSTWAEQFKELKELLTPEEYARARASTINAHYTSPTVVRAMWDALRRIGFRNGKLIEPGAGVGHFFGFEPGDLADASVRTAIEMDPMSGRILKQLYQNADVRIQNYGEFRAPNESFDLAVGNVPFGKVIIHDPAYNKYKLPIHNYFILKTLDKLRPRGVAALITSHYTMDAQDPKARQLLASRADLLGAIRLPNDAFKKNAGTEVTTDILFFKKRPEGEKAAGEDFAKLKDFTNAKGETLPINEYFVKHPDMMLGSMELAGTMRRKGEPALIPNEGQELDKALAEAIGKLPGNAMEARKAPDSATIEASADSVPDFKEMKQYGLAVKNGKVYRRVGDSTERLMDFPNKNVRTLEDMLRVRDAVRELLKAEVSDRPQAELAELRQRLNRFYDRFVERNGAIHQQRNERLMHADPDLPLLLSIEDYDKASKTAKKGAVFNRRVVTPTRVITKADNPKDAMLITLAEKGRLDFDHMTQLTGKPAEEMQSELRAQGLIFHDPDGHWETTDMYLSGNVRDKLRAAEDAAETNSEFAPNVEALRAVIPKDIPPSQIYVRLGSSWLPTEVVKDFIAHLLDTNQGRYLNVRHDVRNATWEIDGLYGANPVANTVTWGTKRAPAAWLIQQGLNQRPATVYDQLEDKKRVVNQKETTAAEDKLAAINEELRKWMFGHPEHGPAMHRRYNDLFNSLVEWKPSGAHLTFPGSSPEITLRDYQKNGVWRTVAGKNNTLLSWEVGVGKTFPLIGTAMEWRRLGLKKKPLLVVPTHLVEQFRQDFLRMYPMANVLAADPESFKTENRKEFLSRIGTGDWDAVVVGDSQFKRIPSGANAAQMAMEDTIGEAREQHADAVAKGADKRTVKELETQIQNMEAQIAQLRADEKKDDVLTFPELGVDGLIVDEAHRMKSLYFPTKQGRLRGVPQNKSQRAMDMYIKSRYVTKINNGNGVVFSTGTPITNTIAEAWILAKYLDEAELKQLGMQHFDAWAANFGQAVAQAEGFPEDPTKLRMVTRFNRFNNIPEATALFRRTADILFADDVGLERPRMVGGKMEPFEVPPSEDLLNYVQTLVHRAQSARGRRPEKGADNMLVITGDGRKAAIDMRMVDPNASDDPQSKLNQVTREVAKTYHATRDQKLTQVIGLDLREGVGGFDAYQDVRKKLIRLGIPKDQIAFIQDYKTSAAKQGLYNQMNEGRIAVLMGSSDTLGIGVNIQKRLVAMHRIDPPWRPDMVEQFNGRGIRWGNLNKEVLIRNYVTKKSFDAYMWHVLNVKNEFRNQFLRGNPDVRSIEDVSGRALNAAEMEAAAADDPRLFRKMELESSIGRLQSLYRSYKDAQFDNRFRMGQLPEEIQVAKSRRDQMKRDAETRDSQPKEFSMTIGNRHFDERKDAGTALNAALEEHEGPPRRIGTYKGFDIYATEDRKGYLQGEKAWEFKMGRGEANEKGEVEPSALGTIQSIEGSLRGIDAQIANAEDRIPKLERELKDRKAKTEEKFEKQTELDKATKELEKLDESLGLNKPENQETVGIEVPEEPEEDEDDEGPGGQTMSFMGLQNAYEAIERAVRRWRRARAARRSAGEAQEGEEGVAPEEVIPAPPEAPEREIGVPEEPPGPEAPKSKAAQPGEKAINIRLDKLNSPDDVIDLIRQTAKSQAGRIHYQRRGKLSDAELQKRMDQVALDPDKLAKLPRGKALNEAEIEVAIGIMQAEADKVREAQREVQRNNSDENILKAQQLHSRYVAIHAAVSGITAEAGRSLRTFRRIHNALDREEKSAYERMIDALGGRKLAELEARKLLEIPEDDKIGQAKFLRDHAKYSTGDKLVAYWKNNILSSPRTMIRKTMGDAIMTSLNFAKIGVRPLIDVPVAAIQRRQREYRAGDAIAQAQAFFGTIPEGMKRAAFIMRNGFDLEDAEELNLPRYELPGGAITNYPSRLLSAATQFFKTVHTHSTLAGLAMREAQRQGLHGTEAAQYATSVMENPPDEMMDEAELEGEKLALVERPDSFLNAVNRVSNVRMPEYLGGVRPLQFLIPFRNIAWNLGKTAVRYSPAGAARLLDPEVRKGPQASNVLAEALIGSLLLASIAEYAAKGNVTGPAPRSGGARDAFFREGKQPFSVKVGNHWIGYPGAISILTPALASMAAWWDSYDQNKKRPSTKQISQVAAAVGAAAADQPLLRGIENLNELIANPTGNRAEMMASETASGFIPGSSLLRTTAGALDPAYRDPQGVYERIKAGLPLLSKTLPQRHDVLGRGETHRGAEGWKAFLPSAIPKAEPLSSVDAELGRLSDKGMRNIGVPGNFITIQNEKIPLSRKETDEYDRIRGTLLMAAYEQVFASDDYKALSDQDKVKEAESIAREATDYAKDEMLRRLIQRRSKPQPSEAGVPMQP